MSQFSNATTFWKTIPGYWLTAALVLFGGAGLGAGLVMAISTQT